MNSPLLKTLSIYKLNKKVYKIPALWEFINYIMPRLPQTCCLAGGSLRTLVNKKEVLHDFDVFFLTNDQNQADIDWGQAKEYFLSDTDRYKKVFECKEGKLVTFLDYYSNIKIQLIKDELRGDMESLLNNFDFNACRFGIHKKDQHTIFTYSRQSIKDVKSKQLSLFNLIYPVATIKRAYKYMNKGYSINNCLTSIVRHLSAPEYQIDEEKLTRIYID